MKTILCGRRVRVEVIPRFRKDEFSLAIVALSVSEEGHELPFVLNKQRMN